MDLARQFGLSTSAQKMASALRVDLYSAQGPFVLEQSIPARSSSSSADLSAVAHTIAPAAIPIPGKGTATSIKGVIK
jgi:hypothetical protein